MQLDIERNKLAIRAENDAESVFLENLYPHGAWGHVLVGQSSDLVLYSSPDPDDEKSATENPSPMLPWHIQGIPEGETEPRHAIVSAATAEEAFALFDEMFGECTKSHGSHVNTPTLFEVNGKPTGIVECFSPGGDKPGSKEPVACIMWDVTGTRHGMPTVRRQVFAVTHSDAVSAFTSIPDQRFVVFDVIDVRPRVPFVYHSGKHPVCPQDA